MTSRLFVCATFKTKLHGYNNVKGRVRQYWPPNAIRGRMADGSEQTLFFDEIRFINPKIEARKNAPPTSEPRQAD